MWKLLDMKNSRIKEVRARRDSCVYKITVQIEIRIHECLRESLIGNKFCV